MARAKATVRRLNRPTFAAAPGQRIGNKNIMNRRQSMFKTKTLLPQHSQNIDCSKKIPLFFWNLKV